MRPQKKLGQIFSLDGDSRGYPVVVLNFQRVINMYVGIIQLNLLDRNRGDAIWSRDGFCDGRKWWGILLWLYSVFWAKVPNWLAR